MRSLGSVKFISRENNQIMKFDSGACIKQSLNNYDANATCLKQASYNTVIVGYNDGVIRLKPIRVLKQYIHILVMLIVFK